ncbi:iron-sulfur cluster-binding protein [Herpetosiphon geysericola]|uniref:Dihydroorotate dehydrogenase electron transfer subunit iron-sulphur cluster binding domain-containing protein n=1 Tax=Herpetosiphon geysericola TaxID=70996 RepID=A0A0P6YMW8_9CHLR|nr:hypothetical protein [Herpetosiphon geysericola]KPL86621.1 hypothetical protein SE18_11490 [Herpetosiphon geysericola]
MQTVILDQQQLNSHYGLLTVASPQLASAQPGQWAMLHHGLGNDPFLRSRAWIIATNRSSTATLALDLHDPLLATIARMPKASELDVLGPLGRPLSSDGQKATLLIAEGNAIYSMLFYAQRISETGAPVLLLASASDELRVPPFVLPAEIEYLATSDDVLDLLESSGKLDSPLVWANRLLAAGSIDLANRLSQRIRRERYAWQQGFASFIVDQAYPCGIGMCGACWQNTRQQPKLLCSHGPALDLRELS